MQHSLLKKIGASAFILLFACSALAQSYPSKPVKIIIPFSAGTALDAVIRMLAQKMAGDLGQPFVVENRTGAGGTIGSAMVASAPADGYTLLAQTSSHTSVPTLMQNIPYDTARDFAGVTTVVENPLVLVASKSTGVHTVQELVAAAKAKPGALSFGSAGVGTITHMGAEKFRIAAGFEALHVPYRGTSDAINEMLAGRINFGVTTIPSALPGIQDGRLVALAMLSERSSALSNVPSMAEAGLPQAGYSSWFGLLLPAKTPRDVVNRLHQEIAKLLAAQETKGWLTKIGLVPRVSTPDEFDAIIRRELAENAQLIKAIGIKPQ